MSDAAPLRGRLAVVTGASAGIGMASARRLAALGMDLVLGARRRDRLEALAAELTAAHDVRALAVPLDVRDAASVAAFAGAAEDAGGEGGVAVLLNNAGLARGVTHLHRAGEDEEPGWEEVLDVNVMGWLRVARRLLPGMVARGGGHVVTLGSMAALEAYEGGAVYCASKAAVRMLSRVLRLELCGTGVRVCCIHPGLVETEFSQVRLGSEDRARQVYVGMTPLTGDEIARVVEWVVSQPEFMNVDEVTLMPTDQASTTKVHRRTP